MKYAYIRDGMVEFIEEREPLKYFYPTALLESFILLDSEQEKIVCKGWHYDGKTFTEPELMSPIPTVGGYYIPNDKDKMAEYVLNKEMELEQQITQLELENIETNQKLTDAELALHNGGNTVG